LFHFGRTDEVCTLRCQILKLSLVAALSGCDPIYAGSDVLWIATHESGDLAEWNADNGGGSYSGVDVSQAGTVESSTESTHSGAYAAKLTRSAIAEESGPGLFRDVRGQAAAYYAAWFLIPEAYVAGSRWTITKFRLRDTASSASPAEGLDLDLRNLPDGDYVLSVFDHDQEYLQQPIAVPTPIVRAGRWFHLEVFYRATGDRTGEVIVWLDGNEAYRLNDHPTAAGGAYFSPCNVARELTPSPAALYVDDAAVSLTRITPEGLLRR
jgi:hypothetical protein